jgi:hypothetical protein
MLAYNYREVLRGRKTLEMARDNVRKLLYETNHALFPYGQIGTNIAELARHLMVRPESPCYAKLHCDTCNKIEPSDAPENIMHITSSSLKLARRACRQLCAMSIKSKGSSPICCGSRNAYV